MLELFEDDHAGPFAEDEAVAVAVERPRGLRAARRCGCERPSSRLKPVTPKGWIMRVRAAGDHHVGVAAADDLGGLADRLGAGGAGGQAATRSTNAVTVHRASANVPLKILGSAAVCPPSEAATTPHAKNIIRTAIEILDHILELLTS